MSNKITVELLRELNTCVLAGNDERGNELLKFITEHARGTWNNYEIAMVLSFMGLNGLLGDDIEDQVSNHLGLDKEIQ